MGSNEKTIIANGVLYLIKCGESSMNDENDKTNKTNLQNESNKLPFDNSNNMMNQSNNLPADNNMMNQSNNLPSVGNDKNVVGYFKYLNDDCYAVKRHTPIGELTVIVNPNYIEELEIQPYFLVAKELADKLGYPKTDNIVSILDSLESKTLPNRDLNEIKDLRECLGVDEIAPRGMTLISEPGLYHILQHSKKPEAVEFRNNVNGIILPNIRQHGEYSVDRPVRNKIDVLLQENIELNNRVSKLESQLAQLLEMNQKLLEQQAIVVDSLKYNVPNRSFSYQECCDYLNTNFPNAGGKVNPMTLKEFLRSIKFLKSTYEPYVSHIRNGIIEMCGNPYLNLNNSVYLTKAGLERVVVELKKRNYIN